MTLDKAVEWLQDETFEIEEAFWSELGGDVYAKYTLRVTDAEELLTALELDRGFDLSGIDNYDTLRGMVEDELNNSFDGGINGVTSC